MHAWLIFYQIRTCAFEFSFMCIIFHIVTCRLYIHVHVYVFAGNSSKSNSHGKCSCWVSLMSIHILYFFKVVLIMPSYAIFCNTYINACQRVFDLYYLLMYVVYCKGNYLINCVHVHKLKLQYTHGMCNFKNTFRKCHSVLRLRKASKPHHS